MSAVREGVLDPTGLSLKSLTNFKCAKRVSRMYSFIIFLITLQTSSKTFLVFFLGFGSATAFVSCFSTQMGKVL